MSEIGEAGLKRSYLARISHGQRAHPPKNAQMICPRLILMYLGRSTVISLAALREFAELQQSAVINSMIAAAKTEVKGRDSHVRP